MNKIVRMIIKDRQLRNAIVAELGITEQAINEWAKLPKGVPPKRVKAVSKVTGLPLHVIRPDVFPRP